MPSNTENLNLYKIDPSTDGNSTFNVETMLNENWDKIDNKFKEVEENIPSNITTTTILEGSYDLKSTASNINFITGDIIAFNSDIDSLIVTKNTIVLKEGRDYSINSNNQSIDAIGEPWVGTVEEPICFDFRVLRNQINNLVFNDGQSIQNGTVTKQKLSTDVQVTLDSVVDKADKSYVDNKIGDLSQIIEDDLVTAIEKDRSQLNDIATEVTNVKDTVDNLDLTDTSIQITDTNNHFTATTLDGVLDEVFTDVSDGKTSLKTAITGKGGTVSSNPTFSQLKTAIDGIVLGHKFASGSSRAASDGNFIVTGLNFKPTIVVVEYTNPSSKDNHDVYQIYTKYAADYEPTLSRIGVSYNYHGYWDAGFSNGYIVSYGTFNLIGYNANKTFKWWAYE